MTNTYPFFFQPMDFIEQCRNFLNFIDDDEFSFADRLDEARKTLRIGC